LWAGFFKKKLPLSKGEGIGRIAQLVKARICNLKIAGSSFTADRVLFWYGSLASLSHQIASVALKHHGKNNGGHNNRIIRVKITPGLLKIYLSMVWYGMVWYNTIRYNTIRYVIWYGMVHFFISI